MWVREGQSRLKRPWEVLELREQLPRATRSSWEPKPIRFDFRHPRRNPDGAGHRRGLRGFRCAIDHQRGALRRNPKGHTSRRFLTNIWSSLNPWKSSGATTQRESPRFVECFEIAEPLQAEFPKNPDYQGGVAVVQTTWVTFSCREESSPRRIARSEQGQRQAAVPAVPENSAFDSS